MASIQDVVNNLESTGIFEFFLPFILMFAVVFGMLQKTQIFGKNEDQSVKKINAVIAFAFAMFIMVFPTTNAAVYDLTDYIADFIGGTLIYVLGIIVFMILLFMIATPLNKGEAPKAEKHALVIGGVVAAVLVVALFISSGGAEIFPGGPYINNGLGFNFLGGGGGLFLGSVQPGVVALIVVVVVIALAVYWMTKW